MIDFSTKYDREKIGIAKHAVLTPDKPALIMNEVSISFQEFDSKSNALANSLLDLGIEPEDRICILMHNSPEILISWSSAGKILGIPIALNYRFKADELAYIINDSESKLLIYSEEFEDIVNSAKPKFDSKDLIYVRLGNSAEQDCLDFNTLIDQQPNKNQPQVESDAHGVAPSLIYTSGTTGKPKGVYRRARNRLNALLGYAHICGTTYDDTHLVAGPLYHSAPYAWAIFSLILGNTVVIMPRFEKEEFLHLVEKHRITSTWVVPTMINRIVNLPDNVKNKYNTSTLRILTVGGESFPFPLAKKSVDFFGEGKIATFYGATENSCVTFLYGEEQLKKPGSCGKAAFGNEIRLLDDNMQDVPAGEVGVLYSKSSFLLDEYYKKPEATAACYHEDYFTVGDMARVDEDGYYYIVDRAVDMVISGGVNIYPAEIEEVLYKHPDIYDAAIIGAPDPDWGEKLIAYVTLKEKGKLSGQDIMDYIEEKLASYKKPKEVYFEDNLPYSPSGKLLKRLLKQDYLEQQPVLYN